MLDAFFIRPDIRVFQFDPSFHFVSIGHYHAKRLGLPVVSGFDLYRGQNAVKVQYEVRLKGPLSLEIRKVILVLTEHIRYHVLHYRTFVHIYILVQNGARQPFFHHRYEKTGVSQVDLECVELSV